MTILTILSLIISTILVFEIIRIRITLHNSSNKIINEAKSQAIKIQNEAILKGDEYLKNKELKVQNILSKLEHEKKKKNEHINLIIKNAEIKRKELYDSLTNEINIYFTESLYLALKKIYDLENILNQFEKEIAELEIDKKKFKEIVSMFNNRIELLQDYLKFNSQKSILFAKQLDIFPQDKEYIEFIQKWKSTFKDYDYRFIKLEEELKLLKLINENNRLLKLYPDEVVQKIRGKKQLTKEDIEKGNFNYQDIHAKELAASGILKIKIYMQKNRSQNKSIESDLNKAK